MINKDINRRSWPWHEVWTNTLFHPTEDTWNALLSEGNVSFGRAYVWLTFAALLFPLAYSIAVWLKSPVPMHSGNLSIFMRNILLIGILEPVWYVVLTGTVHFLAKLFSRSGTYSNFFIVFAATYVPISLVRTLTAIVRWLLAFQIGLYAGTILVVCFVGFILPQLIKFNYQVNIFIAFLISIGMAILAYYSAIAIYGMTGLGI